MIKLFFTTFSFCLLSIHCFSQEAPATAIKADSVKETSIDSSFDEKYLMSLLYDSSKSKSSSYFQVGFGLGNQVFSTHNESLDAKESSPSIVVTPTIGYFHKSGFSIMASSFMLNESNSFGVNQYAITPGFSTAPGGDFDFLFSYTRYFINNEYSLYSSPIQNDFYTSLVYRKGWLQPGIALGYSTGQTKEVLHLDTTILGVEKHYYDSISSDIKSRSVILSVEHSFGWQNIFNKSDSFSLTPVFMLNLGSSDNATTAGTVYPINTGPLATAIRKQINAKKKKLTKLQTTSFEAQSIGLDLEGSYNIGNFSIQPSIYLDYYLPKTTAKRFTQIFTIGFSYAF